ncbi:MAG: class I SAM-dependent methyltransferase [Roseobacter sp.]
MSSESRHDEIQGQYATPRNLAMRGSFQAKYATVSWFGWLRNRIDLREGTHILDVGCGPGWLWKAWEKRLPNDLHISLVDISPGMIQEAKTNLSMLEQIEIVDAGLADAVALPHAAETFDVVFLLHVLYHTGDPRSALQEALRVLRPGGQVFVSANTLDNLSELHLLGAKAFGGPAVDPGAALFSLDDAETLVSEIFETAERYDLTDVLTCTHYEDAVGVLLSMPPGNSAPNEQRDHMAKLIREESDKAGGQLLATRRNGLVVGTKSL